MSPQAGDQSGWTCPHCSNANETEGDVIGETLECVHCEMAEAGETYHMLPKVFHATVPGGGDGKVATLMTKTLQGVDGARSLCERRVEPDVDFDRDQMATYDMWAVMRDVLG